MRILHTADIHLRHTDDSRWEALEYLLEIAARESVSLITISGDLFDRHMDVPKLKAPLRDLFNRQAAAIVVLPGNHDVGAIDAGDFYGDNVTVLNRSDQYVDIDDVRVFGIPFERIEGDQVIERLLRIRHNTRAGGTNILLYHGELLDLVNAREGFGDEDSTMYMPVRLSSFDDIGVDYVLAGHFHVNFEVRRYSGGYFVYPGSPVSITRKETGVRKANLFEVGGQPMPIKLETAYFDEIVVKLNPFSREDPAAVVAHRIRSIDKNARVRVRVTGFVDLVSLGKDERDLYMEIGALMTPDIEEFNQTWRDVGVIMQSDLYARCIDRLGARELPSDQATRVRELIMESMMESQDAH